jgi:hypothetical protein
MTKKKPHAKRGRPARTRRIIVRGIKRETPDTRKLARALIALAKEQLAREAETAEPKDSTPDKDESEEPS